MKYFTICAFYLLRSLRVKIFSTSACQSICLNTEYSVRTAMEAVYTLLNVDRGVPEVFGSCYDVRVLLDSTSKMMDGKKTNGFEASVDHELNRKVGSKKSFWNRHRRFTETL